MSPQPLREPQAVAQSACRHLEKMGVRIDEAGQDDASGGIDHPSRACRRAVLERPDRRNPIPDDVDEPRPDEPGLVTERQNRPALHPDVERRQFLLLVGDFSRAARACAVAGAAHGR